MTQHLRNGEHNSGHIASLILLSVRFGAQWTMALLVLNAICNLLSLGNIILVLLLFFLLHYVKVLYEFRDMPPGPRLTCLPIVGNILSLKTKVDKMAETFER